MFEVTKNREVYKELKKKRSKETSRFLSEDEEVLKSLVRSEKLHDGFGSVIAESTTCNRYSGISAQHCKTAQGIKISLTLQTPQDVRNNEQLKLTAELKRYAKMSEVKAKVWDDDWFVQKLNDYKTQVKQEKNTAACIGRIHERGIRAEWVKNSFVVGILDGDIISAILLYLDEEEYLIQMDSELSPKQQLSYHSAGLYGKLVLSERQGKSLAELKRTPIGE